MTQNNRLAPLLAAAGLLLVPLRAGAALAQSATFDEKVGNSSAIILGHVVHNESKFDPSGRWIVTYSTFAVEQEMKGQPIKEITLVVPGGQVGTLHQSTVGVPEFREGDEHVVFVKNSRLGPTVLYFDQGTYDVTTNSRGEKVVVPLQSPVVKVDSQRGMAVRENEETPRTVDQFQQAVTDSLRRLAAQRNQMSMAPRPAQEPSWSWMFSARTIVAVAVAGLAIATWRILRK